MNIAFFSNYLSPHQIPFSDEMYRLLGENYTFVSCEPYNTDRIKMGWEQEQKPYELKSYLSDANYQKARELAETCDVMLWGSAKYEFIQIRKKSGKINIRYSERLFKEGFLSSIKKLDILRQIKFNLNTRSSNQYLFSASAYAPFDFLCSLGGFKKSYRWGYYPHTYYYSCEELREKKSDTNRVSILWTGRLIELKHPEVAILLADGLQKKGIDFSLDIIGNGPLKSAIEELIESRHLTNKVHLLGAMTPENVRRHMEQSDFFIFSSDYNEGWGAVLNESLNSGCVVFCSDEVGSAHYLIKDGVNGFLFNRNSIDDLVALVTDLINAPKKRVEIGEKAYETISHLWSAQNAANRFYEWCKSAIAGELIEYDEGPMSCAKIVVPKGRWWIR